jgi:hypothetical protein
MSAPKYLIDTNVFIGLEDWQEVSPEFAALTQLAAKHGSASSFTRLPETTLRGTPMLPGEGCRSAKSRNSHLLQRSGGSPKRSWKRS